MLVVMANDEETKVVIFVDKDGITKVSEPAEETNSVPVVKYWCGAKW